MELNVLSPTKTPFISLHNVFRCFLIPSFTPICDSDILSTPSRAWSPLDASSLPSTTLQRSELWPSL